MRVQGSEFGSQLSTAVSTHARRFSAALVLEVGESVDIGSATCVQVGQSVLLATAGHNLDRVTEDSQIRIVGPDRLVDDAIPILGFRSSAARGASSIDVAWLELEPEVARAAGLTPLPAQRLRLHERPGEKTLYLVQGLPAQLSSVEESNDLRTIRVSSMGYLTTPSQEIPLDVEVDISMDYEESAVSQDGLSEIDMPSPHGTSGGGVWWVHGELGNGVWTASKMRLVGIVRSHRSASNLLLGVQIQHWLEFLAATREDLRTSVVEILRTGA